MKTQQGFNLLECLLVLVVVAAISLLGIRHYRAYQRHIQIANIKSDIATIQSALNRYYHNAGCEANGQFAENKSKTPSLTSLGLSLPGRPPEIPLGSAYQVAIVEATTTNAKAGEKKPLYVLRVSAEFAPTYSAKRLQWYQHMLGANRVNGQRLIWQTLPSHSEPMQTNGEQFRQMENAARQKLPGAIAVSPSYCAH